ncbi:MAG: hypothetical protein US56_C0044G0009, partial [Candidatus Moranbacteria bacterium GW2011_GWF2_37_7]
MNWQSLSIGKIEEDLKSDISAGIKEND